MEEEEAREVNSLIRSLGDKLDQFYVEAYRLALYGINIRGIEEAKTLYELFYILNKSISNLKLAVSFTVTVLRIFRCTNLSELSKYGQPDFNMASHYPKVDLLLTVTAFFDDLASIKSQQSDALTFVSSVYMNHFNHKSVSIPQFVKVMSDKGVIAEGNVSALDSLASQYRPNFFAEYLKRSKKRVQGTNGDASEVPQSNDTDGSNPVASLEKDAKPPKWNEKLPKETRKEEQFSSELVKDIKVLLMTATKDPEEEEVLRYLEPRDGDKVIKVSIDDHSGIDLYIGKYGENPVIVVNSAESKRFQGPIHAAIVLTIVLRECKDIKYVISIGICFGMNKDDKFADIYISDLVVDQSTKRVGTDRAHSGYRSAQPPVPRKMLHKFEATENFSLLTEPQYSVNVKKGPIIAANTLVDNLAEKEKMKENRHDAVGGEMEGAGIMAAIEYVDNVKAIIIKAVGDWGDGSKDHSRGWKPFAARAAAYYVKEMLSKETFN